MTHHLHLAIRAGGYVRIRVDAATADEAHDLAIMWAAEAVLARRAEREAGR